MLKNYQFIKISLIPPQKIGGVLKKRYKLLFFDNYFKLILLKN